MATPSPLVQNVLSASALPGFRLPDGQDIINMNNAINSASSRVNALVGGTSSGAYHGTFNGAVGSSTPARGTFSSVLQSITVASTAVASPPVGTYNVASTGAKTFTLGANVTGAEVAIICTSVGTATKTVKPAAGVTILGFLSTALGSSIPKTALKLAGKGQAVLLRAMSSTVLQVLSKAGAVTSS